MSIEWTSDLAVGVDAIDAQHQELFRRADALLEACHRGEGRDAVASTIAFLSEYVVEHFSAEEELMRRAKYPGLLEHARAHREFRRAVDDFAAAIMRNGVGADTIVNTNRLIVAWLNDHIRRVDKDMATSIGAKAPQLLVGQG